MHIKTVFCFFAILFAVSCSKETLPGENPEPQPVQPVQPPQPKGYSELYSAFSKGLRCIGVLKESDSTEFLIEDRSSALFCNKDVVIDDCTTSRPRKVALDSTKEWTLDGVKLGIWEDDRKVLNSKAVPLYIYFTVDSVNVKLSNHGAFALGIVDPEFVKSIPVIYLTTKNSQAIVSKEDYVEGTIRISDPDLMYSDSVEFSAPMKIRGRGNSTWGMQKKPYKIKLEEKANLFRMGKDKEWCLLANYADKSLVRNLTAMEISRICSMSWTPKMISCEVYLNKVYKGVYSFCEHKKVSKNRINIDIEAGDMLFELDQDQDEPVSWITTRGGTPLMFSEPNEPTQEQTDFAKKYFDDVETALWSYDFDTVYKMIDRDSFINNYIIQELTKNIDGNFRKSNYLTLEKGGKLVMYFVWDFDLAIGNADYFENPPGSGPTGWWVKNYGSYGLGNTWYYKLFKDPSFEEAVKQRWSEVRDQLETIPDYLEKQAAIIGDDAVSHNFKVWSITDLGWWCPSRTITSYRGELDYTKKYYTDRFKWMDKQLSSK